MLIGWQKRNVKAGDKLKEKQQYVVRWLQEVHQVSCELYVTVNSILLKDFPLT